MDSLPWTPDWNANRKIGVAYSGGVDSTALVFLLKRWGDQRGIQVKTLTIDHSLREGSDKEARAIHQQAIAMGVEHDIITHKWESPPGNKLESAARDARMEWFRTWMKEKGISLMFLGHHLGDNVETFLMRIIRSSGLDGLSCIPTFIQISPGMILVRPLLSIPKSRLEATCRENNLRWWEDPTNESDGIFRNRLRTFIKQDLMPSMRISRIRDVIDDASKIRAANESSISRFLSYAIVDPSSGSIQFPMHEFAALDDALKIKILGRISRSLAGRRPNGIASARLCIQQILSAKQRTIILFGGCRFETTQKHLVISQNEDRLRDLTLHLKQPTTWAHIWKMNLLSVPSDQSEASVIVRKVRGDDLVSHIGDVAFQRLTGGMKKSCRKRAYPCLYGTDHKFLGIPPPFLQNALVPGLRIDVRWEPAIPLFATDKVFSEHKSIET
eukprot:TRINITY_DN8891_c0_g1_i1.p1 TRINITY_DN8891_c0_g1~~TRINITY_DN8891_c0_g1_i1.p1  ORF type:complete len:508 (-),score=67.81 TRINITY_DN8891_c0_g1_i1:23-1351(-)